MKNLNTQMTASTKAELIQLIKDMQTELSEARQELQKLKKDIDDDMHLNENEAYYLNGLCASAVWYNDECSRNGFNEVIDLLISNINGSNKDSISTCLQLLNSVALNKDLLSGLHTRTKLHIER